MRFDRRAHLRIVLASGLLDIAVDVPWWNRTPLRLTAWAPRSQVALNSNWISLPSAENDLH